MNRERDPKQVPIYIAFGSHGNNSSQEGINWLCNKANCYLASSPIGKVVWYFEAPNANDDFYAKFQARRDDGMRLLIYIFNRDSASADIRKSFMGRELQAITALYRRYPNRIVAAFEHSMGDLPADFVDDDRHGYTRLSQDGQFRQALPLFQEFAENYARVTVKRRDAYFINDFKTEVEYPDILAVVGHLGALHTGVYHVLEREGYNISRFFAEKEGRLYLYPPDGTRIRALTLLPQKDISYDQWLKTLFQQTICDELEQRSSGLKELFTAFLNLILLRPQTHSIHKTRQEILKSVYTATRDLDTDKIQELGKEINRRGIHHVAVNLIKPHATITDR